MKQSISMLLMISMLIVSISACNEKELSNNVNDIAPPDNTSPVLCLYCSEIENPNNTYDYIGCYHNQALLDIDWETMGVFNGDDLDFNSTMSIVNNSTRNFLNTTYSMAIDPLADYSSAYGVNTFDVYSNNESAYQQLITNSTWSTEFKTLMNTFFSEMNYISEDENGFFYDTEEKINFCLNLENDISNNTTLSVEEKNCLFLVIAIGKYSCAFWTDYVAPDEVIVTLSNVKNTKISDKKKKPEEKCAANKANGLSTAEQVAVCVANDIVSGFIGSLAGFALGGPFGMAVGALATGSSTSITTGIAFAAANAKKN